ncbi:DNA internalization-related competence protein ComEC/Rec2 [Aliidiomarina sp. Khilg15.8]
MDWWLISAVAGTLLAAWFDPSWPIWPLTVLTIVCLILGHIMPPFRTQSGFHSGLLALVGVLCGIQWGLINARDAISWNLPSSDYRAPVTVVVQIRDIVQQNEVRWRIDAILLDGPDHWPQVNGAVGLRLSWYGAAGERPRIGERWRFETRLRPASGLLNQGTFNYQAYLLRQGIRVTGSVSAGEKLEGAGRSVREHIYQRFESLRETLQHADILLALTIAERQWIDGDDWSLLQRTGVAHVMAISGLHLSLVFATSWWLSRLLLAGSLCYWPRARALNTSYMALGVAWLIALGYAALAGFAVATLRALLLITLAVGYRVLARRISPQALLLRVTAVVLLLDPLAWLDTGFWLSFAAVWAIFTWLWRLPVQMPAAPDWRFRWRQLWRLEVMLTLLLWPLTVLFFGGVALVAPLTNLLVLPLFSFLILPLALIAVMLMLLGLPGAATLLLVADYGLRGVWWVLEMFYPWGWWQGLGLVVTWLLFLLVLLWYAPLPQRWRLLLCAAGLCSAVSWSWRQQQDTSLHLHMLDVGQGSALVVQRGDRALLIDAGPAYPGGFDLGAAVVTPFLRRRGLRPDWLILTHRHRDHTGGANALQDNFDGLQVMDGEHPPWQCKAGQVWIWKGVLIRALAPLPGPSYGANNDSCVLQLVYQGQRILLPGDIERLGEFRLLRRYGASLKSDVLLVAHHGSKTSSNEPFLEQVSPRIGLISSGYLNRFGMPAASTRARLQATGAHLYTTADAGQVSLRWQQNRWHVITYRDDIGHYWFNQHPL